MSLTTPTIQTFELASDWVVEVDTTGSGGWVRVNALNSVKLSIEGNMADSTVNDSGGWEGKITTTRSWTLQIDGLRGYTGPANAKVADPGQVALKTRGLLVGAAAQIPVRFYRPGDANEGFSGRATANYKSAGGGSKDLEPFSCELAGDGALTAITAS